ncbi:SDR family NAD(P)-dependent oxidoreductase [Streptomyces bathyalis]|uniref:SDR family NAD(P)-dependent oxidoreductase n=1 Tax=Streptomyces bathyalis TaxID=2710756 RepID=A0A7T1T7U3_9ACTN|nr:SDR family NAD(P)-dependent oxidoreductase [Streptomyces bathyalis]QPP07986.1 SDR family NAD(P)-dependent oxidoreductase [Streptomyces bathyalis]
MNPRPTQGRTILVTGSTRGMGHRLARELAAGGDTLLLHGRDRTRVGHAVADLRRAVPEADVRGMAADLADLEQVRALADALLDEGGRLDVLVNNAAVGGGPDRSLRQVSAQGLELRFAVNYLAPLVLTRRLLPLLEESAPARVVGVASAGQEPLDFEDLMTERHYDGLLAYCRSKVALIMSVFDLASEEKADLVTVNAVHPASLMDTDMVRQISVTPQSDVEDGVKAVRRLIDDPELEGVTGRYFHRFTEAAAHSQAYDPEARARLARMTARLAP